MKIKWESNSRVKTLASQGKIKHEDVIPRTTTDNFPAKAATIRMGKVREKHPYITVHIRGEAKSVKGWNGRSYEYATTCRINFGGEWGGKVNTSMNSNGDLEQDLTWLDVHNVVEEVKEVLNEH